MFITFYFNIGYRNRVLKKPAFLSLAAITTEPCSIFTADAEMIYEKSILNQFLKFTPQNVLVKQNLKASDF